MHSTSHVVVFFCQRILEWALRFTELCAGVGVPGAVGPDVEHGRGHGRRHATGGPGVFGGPASRRQFSLQLLGD